MQGVGPTTDTGADPGDGGRREPRPDAGRSDRGRRTAMWLVLGAVGGALVALAVVLAVGLALTSAGEPAAEVPRFVEESTAAGIDHTYAGEFPYFVGGGVATFDCDDDRRPDLYLAGGADPAALYRNESPVGGALRFAKVSDPATDLTSVTGAYPIDVDGDGLTDLAVLRNGENVLLRGLGDCRFERANETWGFDGGDALTAAFSATWEGSATLPTLAFGNYLDLAKAADRSCADSELVRPARRETYAAPIPLAPGYCTLSILFSDWDRRATGTCGWQRPPLLPRRRGAAWRVAARRAPAPVHRRRRLAAAGDLGHGHRELRRHRRRPARGVPDEPGRQQAPDPGDATGRPTYRDIAIDEGVTATVRTPAATLPSTAWHPEFQDVNNDGFIDLFVSKGNVEAQPDFASRDPSNLLLGQADGTFVEEGHAAGIASFVKGRGAAVVDLNLDGMLDIVQVNRRVNVSLFRNVGSGTAAEPAADGQLDRGAARADRPEPRRDRLVDPGAVRRPTVEREVTIGGGHASGELGWIHFGLGDADSAEVRVRWPDGELGPWQEVAANAFVRSRETANDRAGPRRGGVDAMTAARLAEIDLPEFGMPEAVPEIPPSVYADRLERLRARTAEDGYDASWSTPIASTARTSRT